jgi:hypothetical protein
LQRGGASFKVLNQDLRFLPHRALKTETKKKEPTGCSALVVGSTSGTHSLAVERTKFPTAK